MASDLEQSRTLENWTISGKSKSWVEKLHRRKFADLKVCGAVITSLTICTLYRRNFEILEIKIYTFTFFYVFI